MYVFVSFNWKGDEWTVMLTDTPRAQRWGRLMRKVETSKILAFFLSKLADGLKITTKYE